jgi:ribosomal 50S subunit-associated protein YjgA (DUF615 family)
MAAEVVVPFDRGQDREPTRGEKAQKRRRLEYIGRQMAQASTPSQKLNVAIDYFRATAADHRVNQAKADIATEHLADRLIASADQLAATIRRNR